MDFLEIDTVYKRGSRTFLHTFATYGWWLTLIGLTFLYLGFAMYWGPLADGTIRFLEKYPDYYISNDMLAQWSAMVGVSFLLVAYLRANVMYRQYKFVLTEHAFRLRTGLFRIREFTFPYSQIANVHIEQPYTWRMLGLASVDIISASDNSSSTHEKRRTKDSFMIPLIDKKLAHQLRIQLMEYSSGESTPLDDLFYDEDEYEETAPTT